ncbi:MAG TPA: endonuclease domain-containing protein [Desulfuromonadaceae bacterium]
MRFLRNDPALKERRRELRRNQTDAERAFWTRVRNGQFFGMRFFRQYSVGPYILDFYCPALKLAVELDGGQHNESEGREYDSARSAYLNAHGIEVVRFWNNEALCEMDGVLALLEQKINSPIATPPDLPFDKGEANPTPASP